MDEQSATRQAELTCENGQRLFEDWYRLVEVRVVEDQHRRLAAEFQPEALHVLRTGGRNRLARTRAPVKLIVGTCSRGR